MTTNTSQKTALHPWAQTLFSAKQKSVISRLAMQAFRFQSSLGLAEGDPTAWRHEHQLAACGKASLTQATNADYRSLHAYFSKLAGHPEVAAKDWSRTGRVKGSEVIGDTHENRETLRLKITHELAEHALAMEGLPVVPIGEGYVYAIARDKFHGTPLPDLTAPQLEQLFFTLRNRIHTREGRPKKGR